jgi:tetratricopeptide (TPR) repeat protein
MIMALLNEKKQLEIDNLTGLAYQKFQQSLTDESFKLMEQVWGLYPDPKENWTEAYNTVKYVCDDCFPIEDFLKAKEWLNRMINNNNLHHSDEECQFYIGKYLFEVGEYEKSLANFKDVVKSADYRYFEDEDPKYFDFHKNHQKYMKQ